MRAMFFTSRELLDGNWERVVPLIEPVIREAARGELTVYDIRRLSEQGKMITALVEDDSGDPIMAMVFEFVHYPQILAVNIVALGGRDLDGVQQEFFATFRQWCNSAGVSLIEASCSRAMARMLEPIGFKSTYQVVRLAV